MTPFFDPSDNTAKKRKKFWDLFEKVLAENGNPFTICPRQEYSSINRNTPTTIAGPIIEFLVRDKILRVSIYIAHDSVTRCYGEMRRHSEEINEAISEKTIGLKPKGDNPYWKDGDKNPDAKRIQTNIPCSMDGDEGYYRDLIGKIIPLAEEYIRIARIYIN